MRIMSAAAEAAKAEVAPDAVLHETIHIRDNQDRRTVFETYTNWRAIVIEAFPSVSAAEKAIDANLDTQSCFSYAKHSLPGPSSNIHKSCLTLARESIIARSLLCSVLRVCTAHIFNIFTN